MHSVVIDPRTDSDSDDTICFIANARDAATLIHAYMTTAENVPTAQITTRDLNGDTLRGWLLTRRDIASPSPDSFNESMSHLFYGEA